MTMSQQKGNQAEKSITAISAIVALSTLLAGCGQGSKSDSSLSDSTALVLCKKEAKIKAPYGFKSSLSDTDISRSGGTVSIVFNNAEVGTALGTTRTQTIRCDVTGTDSDPVLDGFGAID